MASVSQSLLASRKLRVLVVENREETRKVLKENLVRWGYEPILAESSGVALIDEAKKVARDFRCHLAIVDKRLMDDYEPADISGLDLIGELRPTISIMLTAYPDHETTRLALREKGAFDTVLKGDPQILRDALQRAAQAKWPTVQTTPEGFVDEYIVTSLQTVEGASIAVDEITDLLAILFHPAAEITLETLSGSTKSPSESAARRRSVVFRVATRDKEPVFVKLAHPDRISEEVRRYREYVEGKLGGLFYAKLEPSCELWNLGGSVYPFLGKSGEVVLFSQWYKENQEVTKILKPLQHFFGEVWKRKYDARTLMSGTLFDNYDLLWEKKLQDLVTDWRGLRPIRSFPGINGRFHDPRAWIAKKKDKSKLYDLQKCVVHGDLHGDNLFVGNGFAWAIDFERTGDGPVLADFVELEQDIVTRLAHFESNELPIFYELCVVLTQPKRLSNPLVATQRILEHPEALKAFQVIAGLRQIAYEITKCEDAREWYWGSPLNASYIDPVLGEIGDEERRMKTAVLGSIRGERLDLWGESVWPPSGWPSVHWSGEVFSGGIALGRVPDAIPGGTHPQKLNLTDLRIILADLYPDRDSIVRVLADADFSITNVNLSDKMVNSWHNILDEARKHEGAIKRIIEIARRDYPGYPELR